MENELYHYGTPRHSGRYPWGSGENPYQSDDSFLSQCNELAKQGYSDVEIAQAMGTSTTVLRARRKAAKDERMASMASRAMGLKDKGYTNTKIAEELGVSEGTVRNMLKNADKYKENKTNQTVEQLRSAAKDYKYVDVGSGIETYMGVSKTHLNTAIQVLRDEGYNIYSYKTEQLGTGYKTTMNILCPPDVSWKDMHENRDKITLPYGYTVNDDGSTGLGIKPPTSVDPKRLTVRYAEDGGTDMDGVILLRRGMEDLSLGDARYAQVRIKVGEDRYLKGMAMYSDDLPKGTDLLFNTNKTRAEYPDKMETLKKLKDSEDNPFGATIAKQRTYIGKDGEEHLSPVNIVNEEGAWEGWKRAISSQVLSKQPPALAKKQLDKTYEDKFKEFEEISSLTNPEVKKKLLASFADDCDASAVHLKAAAFPRQASKVILPFPDMKENEVYAPGYNDGETVVLIRYPHGGKFEIPTLTVNNKHEGANKYIHNAKDAIGINPKVAERLSGADFDGDTVLVIPNNSGKIKTSPALKGLENFEPKVKYHAYEGMPRVAKEDGFHTGAEMGKVSNLITDMTIKGANQDEIARAVRHSMVVIDAEKHNLNWKQSYQDNAIAQLKEKYQGGPTSGASTLISKAKSKVMVPERSERVGIDPETGEKIFTETGRQYYKTKKDPQTGERIVTNKLVPAQTTSTKMFEAKDAYELSSGTKIENIYADYANKMKALGNQARKELKGTPSLRYSPSANKAYADEVKALDSKLMVALKNSPLERLAQLQAGLRVSAIKKDNPSMDKDELKRLKGQALTAARNRVGAKKNRVPITKKEWEAIQAGAISATKLKRILDNTDLDLVKSYATPRSGSALSVSQISRAKALLDSGKYTQAEVANQLGVSVSTLNNAVNG